MNLKRGFRRIFVAIAILWFMTVATFTIALMPTKQEAPIIHEWELSPIVTKGYRLDDVEEVTKLEERGMITPEETKNVLGTRAAIRELQRLGKLYPDPNLIYKPPSFWQSEEGTKLIQRVNIELLRKWREENKYQQVKFIFTWFLFWVIPLILTYLIGVLIWWIVAGFRGGKV